MKTGTVKFYNSQKGFGFIAPDDGGKDVFVHATALEAAGMRGLVEGQKISFDVESDRRSGKDAAANLQPPKPTMRTRERGPRALDIRHRQEGACMSHKFKVGQSVRLSAPEINRGVAGIYKVVALLPEERGDCQYRVQSRAARSSASLRKAI